MVLVRVSVARSATKLSFIMLLTMVLHHDDNMKFLNAIKVVFDKSPVFDNSLEGSSI